MCIIVKSFVPQQNPLLADCFLDKANNTKYNYKDKIVVE